MPDPEHSLFICRSLPDFLRQTRWHRLLEICAFTDTLILDEDGLYDPAHFNDRFLFGLDSPS
jgi:hypothetical protein